VKGSPGVREDGRVSKPRSSVRPELSAAGATVRRVTASPDQYRGDTLGWYVATDQGVVLSRRHETEAEARADGNVIAADPVPRCAGRARARPWCARAWPRCGSGSGSGSTRTEDSPGSSRARARPSNTGDKRLHRPRRGRHCRVLSRCRTTAHTSDRSHAISRSFAGHPVPVPVELLAVPRLPLADRAAQIGAGGRASGLAAGECKQGGWDQQKRAKSRHAVAIGPRKARLYREPARVPPPTDQARPLLYPGWSRRRTGLGRQSCSHEPPSTAGLVPFGPAARMTPHRVHRQSRGTPTCPPSPSPQPGPRNASSTSPPLRTAVPTTAGRSPRARRCRRTQP
jgi:hypothetical protein